MARAPRGRPLPPIGMLDDFAKRIYKKPFGKLTDDIKRFVVSAVEDVQRMAGGKPEPLFRPRPEGGFINPKTGKEFNYGGQGARAQAKIKAENKLNKVKARTIRQTRREGGFYNRNIRSIERQEEIAAGKRAVDGTLVAKGGRMPTKNERAEAARMAEMKMKRLKELAKKKTPKKK